MRRLPNDNQKQDQHAKWGVANVHAKFNVAYNTNNGYLKKQDQIKLSSLLTSFFCVQNLEKVLHFRQLGSVLLLQYLWFNRSSGFTSCIHRVGLSLIILGLGLGLGLKICLWSDLKGPNCKTFPGGTYPQTLLACTWLYINHHHGRSYQSKIAASGYACGHLTK